jgi:hypothetical protein
MMIVERANTAQTKQDGRDRGAEAAGSQATLVHITVLTGPNRAGGKKLDDDNASPAIRSIGTY